MQILFENDRCILLAADFIVAHFSWGVHALSTGQAGSLTFLCSCNFRSGHRQ